MKKNKLKNLLKCGILLFGISILIISCQNESLEKEVISPEFQTERLEYHRTSASGLFKTDNTLKKHVLKKFSKKKNQNNLRLDSEEYGFSIDTSFVQIIMSSNYNSYTFIVEREDANPNILENYVYTEFSNGGFTQLIASYPIIDLDDEISYDIENSSAQYIIDEDLLAARTINCGSFSEEIYGFDPNAGECIDYNCTAGENHTYGQSCDGSPDQQPYQECAGGWVVTGCVQFIDEFGGGGSSGAGDGGTNNNDTNDDETEEDPTEEESPQTSLIPFGTRRECKKITKFLNDIGNQTFKNELIQLSNQTNLNLTKEKAIAKFKDDPNVAQYQGVSNSLPEVQIPALPTNEYRAFAHTHPNIGNGTLSVFSIADLVAIATAIKNNKLNTNKFVAFLTTKKGTEYALTINNKSKFLDFFYYKLFKGINQVPIDKYQKYWDSKDAFTPLFDKYYDPKNINRKLNETDSNNENVLTEFLNFMESADAGFTLFDASSEVAGQDPFNSFRKITLEDGLPQRDDPCN